MAKVRLEAFDWRYSSAIVGIYKYLEYNNFYFEINEDYLEFEEEDIKEDKYLEFVEIYFSKSMHHIEILNNIDITYDDESKEKQRIKYINEKMNGNTILKKIFSKIKYDTLNQDLIKSKILENRLEIIKSTYKSGRSLYYNFCNENQLFEEEGKICRLNGYYLDMNRKSKGNSYRFDSKSYVFNDSKYFDFIPFGFSRHREAFFINSNITIQNLIDINIVEYDEIVPNPLLTNILFNTDNASQKIQYDVEVIVSDREKDYFETFFIRKDAINIFDKILDSTKDIFKKPCNVGKLNGFSTNEYIQIEKIVANSILNLLYLDDLIEFMFKISNKTYLNKHLILVNRLIYKEEINMQQYYNEARDDAFRIKNKLLSKSNKLRSYEQKLVAAISLKDYDKVKEILIHLSSYTQLPIRALIPLCKDFEKNKNLVYTFVNCLGEKENFKDDKGGN